MRNLSTILLIIFSMLAYSCAPTYHPVYPEPVNIKTIIKPGDDVKITTIDENQYVLEVVDIYDNAIVGKTEKVLFKDIRTLQEMNIHLENRPIYQTGKSSAIGISNLAGHYPKYHPGDFYSIGKETRSIPKEHYEGLIIELLDYNHPADELIIVPVIFWNECKNKCEKELLREFNCEDKPFLSGDYTYCKQKYDELLRRCVFSDPYDVSDEHFMDRCLIKKYKNASISEHISAGYYSDGSFYHSDNRTYFKNVHPSKDNYTKTKWQKDRDECMKLTDENIKEGTGLLKYTVWEIHRFYNKSVEYYQNCLKERGYEMAK